MKLKMLLLAAMFAGVVSAQIYSPKVLRDGQPDASDLKKFTAAIYRQANATTPRAKAEAIWRFFLTDGRFVKPGFWYHIAGWAYEEPGGEVLDPIKLLNSYGFGLCYHIAPLLEAIYEAGGFADARVWFLTGHTVTEVFYDGGYHYFDSDMLGYNVKGSGPFQGKPVACVRQLEQDSSIILGKMAGPRDVRSNEVDYPWYPADLREAAMPGLAELFTTTADNYLFPYTRYSSGHSMDFVLRPGEKLTRYFHPEEPGLAYLPYKFDGKEWREFPEEIPRYKIRTADGPRSQRDDRAWATGSIEYTPPSAGAERVLTFDMPSPYVIIDARFTMNAGMAPGTSLRVDTSTDGGASWERAGEAKGPHTGAWTVEPRVLARSEHGRWTAVSGTYGYKVRITCTGKPLPRVTGLRLTSRIQLNPRTLPAVESGTNAMVYSAASAMEWSPHPVRMKHIENSNFEVIEEHAQSFLRPPADAEGKAVFELSANGRDLVGFDAGARFLDLHGNLAPEKLTAETRATAVTSPAGTAAIEWSLNREGPFTKLWSYPAKLEWRDGDPVDRMLMWPQAFEQIRHLPPGTKRVYVRLRSAGPSIDDIRLAVLSRGQDPRGKIRITHVWREAGSLKQHIETLGASERQRRYSIVANGKIQNEAILMEAIP